jgi:hypothetical protein
MMPRGILPSIFLALAAVAPLCAQPPDNPQTLKIHDVGNVLRVVVMHSYTGFDHQGPFCEYPRGSGIEHIYRGSDTFPSARSILW